jgi:excisionase family DNA binding protein
MADLEPQYYSIKEVAEITRMSRWFIGDEIKAGRLVAHKMGRSVRIGQNDLMRWAAANEIEPQDPLVKYRLIMPRRKSILVRLRYRLRVRQRKTGLRAR